MKHLKNLWTLITLNLMLANQAISKWYWDRVPMGPSGYQWYLRCDECDHGQATIGPNTGVSHIVLRDFICDNCGNRSGKFQIGVWKMSFIPPFKIRYFYKEEK